MAPIPHAPNQKRAAGFSPRGLPCANRFSKHSAFTLVELLVVMLIMTVLISSVLVAGNALITSSKVSNTKALLTVVEQSIQSFRREQRSRPTLTRIAQGPATNRVKYTDLYAHYPPDELEVFTDEGLRGAGNPRFSAAPRRAVVFPPAPYVDMKFDGQIPPSGQEANEHRDIAALYLAIQLFGTDSKQILDRVQDHFWKDGPVDGNDVPLFFLDRGPTNWDMNDIPIRFLVDDWGVPLSYMAQRDFDPTGTNTASTNHNDWNEASTEMIRLNKGRPIIFSWGPDGLEQLTPETMGTDARVSLVGDFKELDGVTATKRRIENPLNQDNVYASDELKAKLDEGIK